MNQVYSSSSFHFEGKMGTQLHCLKFCPLTRFHFTTVFQATTVVTEWGHNFIPIHSSGESISGRTICKSYMNVFFLKQLVIENCPGDHMGCLREKAMEQKIGFIGFWATYSLNIFVYSGPAWVCSHIPFKDEVQLCRTNEWLNCKFRYGYLVAQCSWSVLELNRNPKAIFQKENNYLGLAWFQSKLYRSVL